MIKFFRTIRQKLLSENKFSKYLIYAIGEIILVVIGILIALSLNNWNDKRKNDNIKHLLINDLILELQSSKKSLKDAITMGDTLITSGHIFLKHIGTEEMTIEIDSLKKLGHFITDGIPYDLNLPIYENSKSSGKLTMFENKMILVKYAEVMATDIGRNIHRKISNDMFYNGSDWELKKEIGTSKIFNTPNELLPEKFRLSEKEFQAILERPSTYASINNTLEMKINRISYMEKISNSMTEIIELLEAEKR